MKPRSGRTIPLYFKVSPEEKEIIEKKMAQLGIHNQRAYLRKMAVEGMRCRWICPTSKPWCPCCETAPIT